MLNKKEQIINEVMSSVTHGIGIFLSIAALVLLIIKGVENSGKLLPLLIYGISLLILYFSSTLFHSLYFTRAQKTFRLLDHTSIFILIAGTYTPFCLLGMDHQLGRRLLLAIWILSLLGIGLHLVLPVKFQWVETSIYVILGWLCLVGFRQLWDSLGKWGFLLLLGGGLCFTFGAIIFYSICKLKYAHVYWHIMVLAGTILMFFAVFFYL